MKIGQFENKGYHYLPNYFLEEELFVIESIIEKFHNSWLAKNQELYSKGILNSHSLTSSNFLGRKEKKVLFNFLVSNKLLKLIEFDNPKFLNTQLFFDPKNKKQQNYWHRDIQYTGITEKEQKEAIKTQNVLHFRIPFTKEPGIELIPGTHRRWDTDKEYEVRNELNNKKPYDSLKKGKVIPLERGDLLVFSANMIHRGLYGNNRLSFDIIYCDNNPNLLKFRAKENLPNKSELSEFENVEIFE